MYTHVKTLTWRPVRKVRIVFLNSAKNTHTVNARYGTHARDAEPEKANMFLRGTRCSLDILSRRVDRFEWIRLHADCCLPLSVLCFVQYLTMRYLTYSLIVHSLFLLAIFILYIRFVSINCLNTTSLVVLCVRMHCAVGKAAHTDIHAMTTEQNGNTR